MNTKQLDVVRHMRIKKDGHCVTLTPRGGADRTREYRSSVDMEAMCRVYMLYLY